MTEEQAQELAWFYTVEDELVSGLRSYGLSQTKALKLAGIAASAWHYRHHGRPRVGTPIPHRERVGEQWLTDTETAAIIALLMQAFEAKKSVFQGYYEALDAGNPVASLRSWYRITDKYLPGCRPARRTRKHRCTAMPQWSAEAPMQVWSWDITKLPSTYRGISFNFYVTMDVFSRKIVGWRVEEHEDDQLATDMFETAFAACGGRPDTVHSDGGPSMTSKSVTGLFRQLGVTISRNRPRVSNDNPFSESLFKTAKYGPDYPPFFRNIEHARAWAAAFVDWYNNLHRHSSLEGHTPASIHDGSWVQIHLARQEVLDRLYAANPQRYPRPPQARTPLAQTVLNQTKTEERLTPA